MSDEREALRQVATVIARAFNDESHVEGTQERRTARLAWGRTPWVAGMVAGRVVGVVGRVAVGWWEEWQLVLRVGRGSEFET